MPNSPEIDPVMVEPILPSDVARASASVRRTIRGTVPAALVSFVAIQLVAGWIVTSATSNLTGFRLAAVITLVSVAVLTPCTLLLTVLASRKTIQQLADSYARERRLHLEGRQRSFETQLANALEMASTESHVLSTVGRALTDVAPDDRIELLLADNSHAHLHRQVTAGPSPDGPGCRVESPDGCVAARRGQTQIFADSSRLDACPHLAGRDYGRCSAVCVPVSIMGRTVGVLHQADPELGVPDSSTIHELEVLASQTGGRLGMLRVMGESSLQAATDPLTGLANRRAFENRIARLHRTGQPYTVVMADLDHFKLVNDTFGHEAGDRALRIYAKVLADGVRPDDVVCRYGGEEFVLAFANTTAQQVAVTCERLRESLALALANGVTPAFTASYGIAAWSPDKTYEELIALADNALYQAKHQGRNRATIHDTVTAPPPDLDDWTAATAAPVLLADGRLARTD
jgi:diguanylate cyclase (GGDEF)-like protein